ncbi:MAG: efflux RND transporter periplasmic adaptor subunit [Blastocatellia bacterium]
METKTSYEKPASGEAEYGRNRRLFTPLAVLLAGAALGVGGAWIYFSAAGHPGKEITPAASPLATVTEKQGGEAEKEGGREGDREGDKDGGDAGAGKITLSAEAIKRGGIETAEVSTQSFHQMLAVTGRLAINEDTAVRIGSIVEGRVTKIAATVGDQVSAGQTVVLIHSHEVAEGRRDYARAGALVAQAEKSLALATQEQERARRLYELQAVSQKEMQQAALPVTTATAELKTARAELHRAEEFLHHLGVQPDGPDEAIIRAPVSGTVIKREVSVGTVVTPATDLLLVANLSTLWLIAEVPEKNAQYVRPGQAVFARFQSMGDAVIRGRVTRIENTLNPETRTIRVRCEMPNSRGALRPEMYATVELAGAAGDQALAVPREAVLEMGDERVVFVAAGENTFEKRRVETGRQQGNQTEVLRGLRAGERIVARGGFLLKTQMLKSTLEEE